MIAVVTPPIVAPKPEERSKVQKKPGLFSTLFNNSHQCSNGKKPS